MLGVIVIGLRWYKNSTLFMLIFNNTLIINYITSSSSSNISVGLVSMVILTCLLISCVTCCLTCCCVTCYG